jgi:hypothetical protein
MKRRIQTAPDLLQVGLAQSSATITSDFKKVVAGVQRSADRDDVADELHAGSRE